MMEHPKLGPTQASIMHRALDEAGGYSVIVGPERECRAARMLNSKGFLVRDKVRADLYFASDKARVSFAGWVYEPEPDIEIGSAVTPVETVTQLQAGGGASDLAVVIRRAQGMFDDGDYNAALMLSSGAYDQAKAAAGYASKVKASQELIDKARRMQADALKIESTCWVKIADVIEEAQTKGQVAKKGRKSNVHGADIFTLEEIGVDRRRLLEARKLRAAVEAEPGFVDRVIEARLALGMDPSRSNLRAAIGTASASKDERGHNFYQTPEVATRTLLALESFSGTIWEPSCGAGAISRVLEGQGYEVIISDFVDRGTSTADGALQAVGDFTLSQPDGDGDGPDIVTNPPYGDVLNDYVAHALRVHKPRKMALLLNLNFLCGFADEERNFVMDDNPPSRVYVFKRRLPMMHREGYDGKKASSRMNTAWFIWERQEDGTYGDATLIRRVDWADYQIADPLFPGERGHVTASHFVEDFTRETPRRSLDERVEDERARALIWAGGRDDFDAIELRRGIGVRPSTADALIEAMRNADHVQPADEPGRWVVSQDGWSVLKAMAGVVVASGLVDAVAA